MKTVAEICSALMAIKIEPDRIVSGVYTHGKLMPFASPCRASEVVCPMCSGTDGFYIVPDKAWSCLKTECLNTNAGLSNLSPTTYKPPRPTMKTSGVWDAYLDAKFDDLDEEQKPGCVEFCKTFRGFFLIAGSAGSGKTYAACACLRKYLNSKDDCKFINVADLYYLWLDASKEFNRTNLLDKYDCELLVLDDIGTIAPKDGFLEFLYLIINRRVSKISGGTIITTNLNSKSMTDMLGSPLTSRICSGQILRLNGKDKRIVLF